MRTRHLLVAAAVGAMAILPAAAGAATLRVVTPQKTVFGATATHVGSARSYVDTRGRVHKLKRHTALGQLVAASAYTGTELSAVYYPEYKSAVVTEIDGVKAPKSGYWALFVNGYPAALGADNTILKKSDNAVWIADDDYSLKDGPFVYDLRSKTNANGTVTFTGWQIGGPKPLPATGQRLIVNGALTEPLDAKGKLTLAVTRPWTATIGERGNIAASEALTG